MSNRQTQEILEMGVEEGVALEFHLRTRHYPPVPYEMVPCIKRAIQLARRGNWGWKVKLPEGVLWRGKTRAPVHEFVNNFHLDPFIQEEGDA